jgi:hypothetical protein
MFFVVGKQICEEMKGSGTGAERHSYKEPLHWFQIGPVCEIVRTATIRSYGEGVERHRYPKAQWCYGGGKQTDHAVSEEVRRKVLRAPAIYHVRDGTSI